MAYRSNGEIIYEAGDTVKLVKDVTSWNLKEDNRGQVSQHLGGTTYEVEFGSAKLVIDKSLLKRLIV